MLEYPYQIYGPTGQCVMQAPASCRYSPRMELSMLDAGYTIRIHGKRLTKTDLRKEVREL